MSFSTVAMSDIQQIAKSKIARDGKDIPRFTQNNLFITVETTVLSPNVTLSMSFGLGSFASRMSNKNVCEGSEELAGGTPALGRRHKKRHHSPGSDSALIEKDEEEYLKRRQGIVMDIL